jgi:hypothetical protein
MPYTIIEVGLSIPCNSLIYPTNIRLSLTVALRVHPGGNK